MEEKIVFLAINAQITEENLIKQFIDKGNYKKWLLNEIKKWKFPKFQTRTIINHSRSSTLFTNDKNIISKI